MFTINKGIPDLDWDERLAELGGHFLQSRGWAEFQVALGRSVVWACDESWAWQATLRQGRGVSYLYAAYGPTATSGGLSAALESLAEAGRAQRATFVRIEPNFAKASLGKPELLGLGLKPTNEVQPQHTWMLDLAPDEAVLRSNLSSGNRNIMNTAERKGVDCRLAEAGETEPFLRMLHETYARAGIKAYDDDYYRKTLEVLEPQGEARLFYAEFEGKIAAGALVYDWNGIRHYAHAAADSDLNKQSNAARILVWHMIMDAKDNDFAHFDFWGVAPTDDPKHPWHGLSQFKKTFGGYTVDRAGTWDLPLSKVKYRGYRLAKRVFS